MSLNDIQLHNDTSSCLLVCADLLPLSFSSRVNNKQLPRRQVPVINRLWLLMKSMMLLFLVGKRDYFNSQLVCPLLQPHPLGAEEQMFPFFTVFRLSFSCRYLSQNTWYCLLCVCLYVSKTMKRDTSSQILPGKPFDMSNQSHSRGDKCSLCAI